MLSRDNKISFLIFICLLSTVVLVSCGEKKEVATADESSSYTETTAVLSTEADGAVTVKDGEDNIVCIDKSGSVTAVKDKSGNEVEVKSYLNTHTVSGDASVGYTVTNTDTSHSTESDNSSVTKSETVFDNKDSSSSDNKSEETIPVAIGEGKLDDSTYFPDI